MWKKKFAEGVLSKTQGKRFAAQNNRCENQGI
jgi:hypothetical protein